MTELTITAWGHAAVGFERGSQRLLIDPGELSDPGAIAAADVVLVTHEHPDHFAEEALSAALRTDTDLHVWGPDPVVSRLAEAGAPAERIHEATDGTEFGAAGSSVRVIGRQHALIHPDIPRVANVGYLVDGAAFHPGDSFEPLPDGISPKALLLPVSAPWLKLAEAVDYLRDVAPATVVPIHDAFLSDSGKAVVDRLIGVLAGQFEYRRLDGGASLTLTA